MGLSRKRKRALKKIRNEANSVWEEQREVLDHASKVLRAASHQAGTVARDDVAPRVRESYEKRVQPSLDAGIGSVRNAASATKKTVTKTVLPAVSGAIGSALAAIDVVRDQRIREALYQAGATGRDLATRAGQKVGLVETKPTHGPGRYILIGVGVLAVAGVAYAAWQTLRADDDLWVADDIDDEIPATSPTL